MARTLAIMPTCTTYGTWLRGDQRGWVEDGIIYPPNPQLEAADRARMKHPPFLFDHHQLLDVGVMIAHALTSRLNLTLLALSVQTWHVHAVIGATSHHIGDIVKCLKDAARYGLRPGRPIWTEHYDKRFCFTIERVRARVNYVERHNLAMGWGPAPPCWQKYLMPLNEYLAHICK
jgi:hypothetical protein